MSNDLISSSFSDDDIKNLIFEVRGHKVMLDKDLAKLYEVETYHLNLAVKRNPERFPDDFMFKLTDDELKNMVIQNVLPSKSLFGGHLPFVFTKNGSRQLASVLRSKPATEMSIRLLRVFEQFENLLKDSYMIENKIERAKRWIQEEEVRQQLLLENKEKTEIIEKQEEEIEFLEKEVEEKTEKAECAERFLDFEIIGFDMNEAAQNLSLKLGGRNKLMKKLREDNILMKETKEVYYENGVKIIHIKNIPYWHFVKAGYFVTKTSRTERENVINIYTKTRVTTKGLDFLRRKYN